MNKSGSMQKNVTDRPRVGVITLSLPRESPDLTRRVHREIIATLCKTCSVVANKEIALSTEDSRKQFSQAIGNGAECIIFVIGSWIFTPQVLMPIIGGCRVPLAIWAIPNMKTGGMVGGAITHGALDEIGISHRYLVAWPDQKEEIEALLSWIRAASVKFRLSRQTYGLIGGMSMGMYPAMVDYTQVLSVFGVQIKHIDQLMLVNCAQDINSREVKGILSAVKDSFGKITASQDLLSKSIKLYLAARKLIESEKLDFIGIKCQPELIEGYASACLAIALLNDDYIVAACEADTNGALTMQILKLAYQNLWVNSGSGSLPRV